MIRKFAFSVTVSLFTFSAVHAQGGLLSGAKSAASSLTSGKGLSTDDIVAGLKDALNHGTQKSTAQLSAVDGFFKDAAVKILLPPEAADVEKKLRAAGFGKQVDDAILSINRAAEDAAKSAAAIFLNAIKNMTVTDGGNILKGSDTAATSYLRKTTSAQLTASFHPVIDSTLQKTGATKYWKQLFDTYNKMPLVQKVNSDL